MGKDKKEDVDGRKVFLKGRRAGKGEGARGEERRATADWAVRLCLNCAIEAHTQTQRKLSVAHRPTWTGEESWTRKKRKNFEFQHWPCAEFQEARKIEPRIGRDRSSQKFDLSELAGWPACVCVSVAKLAIARRQLPIVNLQLTDSLYVELLSGIIL